MLVTFDVLFKCLFVGNSYGTNVTLVPGKWDIDINLINVAKLLRRLKLSADFCGEMLKQEVMFV